ncbi:hypothetical protein [Granulicella sp. L46]|uniref:hypothetical protein n=1 Tax=Granulicella sp. L46 TaxID=1641865 RepID=UPI00131CB5F6|nr:hypothetical protein [Granulicella sp. L46]
MAKGGIPVLIQNGSTLVFSRLNFLLFRISPEYVRLLDSQNLADGVSTGRIPYYPGHWDLTAVSHEESVFTADSGSRDRSSDTLTIAIEVQMTSKPSHIREPNRRFMKCLKSAAFIGKTF